VAQKNEMEKTKMKRLITICAVVVIMCALPNVAQAALWEIQDAGLGDTINFVNTIYGTNGNLNSRNDILGDPGYQFNITLTNNLGGWTDLTIGDNFDLPTPLAGLVSATGNSGDLSSYTGYTMSIQNPGTDSFWASLYMNTGWTDPPLSQTNRYYQSGDGTGVWIASGQTKTLTIDFTNAAWWNGSGFTTGQTVQNLGYVTDIGFKIGANLGNQGEVISGTAFNVNTVPEPATIALLGLGGLFLRRKRRA
jgi:hypothetical protein